MIWDPIETREQGTSVNPFTLNISDGVTCGTTLPIKFTLTGNNKTIDFENNILLGTNIGQQEVFSASGLPEPILDNQTATAEINIPTEGDWANEAKISNARLKFDIQHTYIGDLTIHLESPAGEKILIYKGRGGADDIQFDKDITNKLIGKTGAGTWTLQVHDKANRDEGNIDTYTLILTPALYECE